MTKRYDASAPREYKDRDGNTKTAWNRVGVAFEKDGKITVLLEAYPLPGADGTAKIILMEPREKSAAVAQPAPGYPSYGNDDDLDQAPF